MAEEEVVVPVPSDNKRKLEDLEQHQAINTTLDLNVNSELDFVENAEDDEKVGDGASDAKRPRLEDKTDGLASENGYTAGKDDETEKEDADEQSTVDNLQLEDAKDFSKQALEVESNEPPAEFDINEQQAEVENNEQPASDNHETKDAEKLIAENTPQLGNTDLATEGEQKEPSLETSKQGDVYTDEQQLLPSSEAQSTSRKMDVPNNKVGVLIGKAGDTIRYLQYNSGAKIQITRDVDADPYSTTRPVELIGGLENINRAERLIKDVIAEADAGGSPSLVARGFATAPTAGGGEQIQIQVPNEKVGLIIGKGGETIKNLQTRSGARIQLIPQHLPEGDQSKERTVRVTGDKKQIEMAREMIKEVMNQTMRPSSHSSGYNQQTCRPCGSTSASQWGPHGLHPGHTMGYDYQHRGSHPSQNPQYPAPTYGSYPPQQVGPRGGYGSGWEQRPPATMQGAPHGGGYDYYGRPGVGHLSDTPGSVPHSNSFPAHVPGRSPAPAVGAPSSQANYKYGQMQGMEYGQPAPYSQTPSQQNYGHGYEEPKYGNQASTPHPYGVHGSSNPTYPQSVTQSGYASQQQYGRLPSYGMQSHGPPPQSYGPPRASQPGYVPYQGPYPPNQSYGQNVPPQQSYPYASSGPMQQTYPPYGSTTANDGYNQQPSASAQGYTQQAVQPVSVYGQPGGQPGYVQGTQGGYGPYPSTQPGYGEQPTGSAPNNAGYGYQGPADPSYNSGPNTAYSAPPSAQQGYAQPVPAQATYDHSAPPSGGYAGGPGSAPVGYGKSVSPQPGYSQYDSTQVYGAHG